MTDEYEGYEPSIAAIMRSYWSTETLQGFALGWSDYDTARTPIWQSISSDEETAREFYAQTLAEDDEYARYMAAEALVHTGWTIDRINYRKS